MSFFDKQLYGFITSLISVQKSERMYEYCYLKSFLLVFVSRKLALKTATVVFEEIIKLFIFLKTRQKVVWQGIILVGILFIAQIHFRGKALKLLPGINFAKFVSRLQKRENLFHRNNKYFQPESHFFNLFQLRAFRFIFLQP